MDVKRVGIYKGLVGFVRRSLIAKNSTNNSNQPTHSANNTPTTATRPQQCFNGDWLRIPRMNHYLFVFPHKAYLDFEWKFHKEAMLRKAPDVNPAYLNDIIHARYRKKGFTINWLLFGNNHDVWDPALDGVSPWLLIEQGDRVLCAGITYYEMTTSDFETKLDFAPSPIIANLPKLERLVLGGFHQDDCVEKFARAAHDRGIDVHTDEDTTQFFFSTTALYGRIPLLRRKPWPHAGLYKETHLLEEIREFRSTRPWLTQV